jgi:heptosyltransferase-2
LRDRVEVDVLLVGGAAEVEKTNAIMVMCGAHSGVQVALTEKSIPEFVALLNEVDVLLCGDTLALHIAAAVGLPAVVIFGPTSSSEIFDFDGLLAKAWTNQLDCLGCYGDCAKDRNCMSLLELSHLVDLTHIQLARPRQAGMSD